MVAEGNAATRSKIFSGAASACIQSNYSVIQSATCQASGAATLASRCPSNACWPNSTPSQI